MPALLPRERSLSIELSDTILKAKGRNADCGASETGRPINAVVHVNFNRIHTHGKSHSNSPQLKRNMNEFVPVVGLYVSPRP
jgi:hypothetical protein